MLLRPNESICIQGAFFLSQAGGSKQAATQERVQGLEVEGGGLRLGISTTDHVCIGVETIKQKTEVIYLERGQRATY